MIMMLVIQLPVLVFSVIVHECAHGWTAERCGDDTARAMGRITLNPLPHIDLVGTIIIPVMTILFSPYIFGYAKPVPVNPYRFNHPRRDAMLVSASGPISNLLLAVVFAIVMRILIGVPFFSVGIKAIIIQLCSYAVLINLILALLNLIPVPPLDGSGIVSGLLPQEAAFQYERLRPYGLFILFGLLIFGVIGSVLTPILSFLSSILLGGIRI
ncbi:MAG: site-2 protease family protein [Elusimicrobia bacterium]|nr:site-2 protease family protein [Elusimicrobiota bacterium]MBD3412596.1 site-2 protease family protein [Elusimicrobiota bacterium]